jgi:hypothetical protein
MNENNGFVDSGSSPPAMTTENGFVDSGNSPPTIFHNFIAILQGLTHETFLYRNRDTYRDSRTDATPGEFNIEDLVLNKKVTEQQSLYRILTEDKNREAVESIVAEYFDGFALSNSIGYWKGNRHTSLIIEVIANDAPHTKERVIVVAQRIRELNGQECVLVQELPLFWCRFLAAEMSTPMRNETKVEVIGTRRRS